MTHQLVAHDSRFTSNQLTPECFWKLPSRVYVLIKNLWKTLVYIICVYDYIEWFGVECINLLWRLVKVRLMKWNSKSKIQDVITLASDLYSTCAIFLVSKCFHVGCRHFLCFLTYWNTVHYIWQFDLDNSYNQTSLDEEPPGDITLNA